MKLIKELKIIIIEVKTLNINDKWDYIIKFLFLNFGKARANNIYS